MDRAAALCFVLTWHWPGHLWSTHFVQNALEMHPQTYVYVVLFSSFIIQSLHVCLGSLDPSLQDSGGKEVQPCENNDVHPGWCDSVGWELTAKPKGQRFNSWSGHIPGLWVRSPVGVHMKGNQSMYLSPINVSLSLLLLLPSL